MYFNVSNTNFNTVEDHLIHIVGYSGEELKSVLNSLSVEDLKTYKFFIESKISENLSNAKAESADSNYNVAERPANKKVQQILSKIFISKGNSKNELNSIGKSGVSIEEQRVKENLMNEISGEIKQYSSIINISKDLRQAERFYQASNSNTDRKAPKLTRENGFGIFKGNQRAIQHELISASKSEGAQRITQSANAMRSYVGGLKEQFRNNTRLNNFFNCLEDSGNKLHAKLVEIDNTYNGSDKFWQKVDETIGSLNRRNIAQFSSTDESCQVLHDLAVLSHHFGILEESISKLDQKKEGKMLVGDFLDFTDSIQRTAEPNLEGIKSCLDEIHKNVKVGQRAVARGNNLKRLANSVNGSPSSPGFDNRLRKNHTNGVTLIENINKQLGEIGLERIPPLNAWIPEIQDQPFEN